MTRYLPSHFAPPDADAAARLVAGHPLAMLAWAAPDGLEAEHLPLLWDRGDGDGEHGTLRGHVARANPVWHEADGRPVIAVFRGPQAYITPSWYPSKAETAKVVPTWNYAVVQLRGTLRAVADAPWLHALVERLTDTHEAPRPHRWHVSDAPADYIAQMLRAIVGIEVAVDAVQAKWKMSQNRSEADRAGVAAGLDALSRDEARAAAALVRGGNTGRST
jgi:transcriptional regulator